MSMGFRIGGEYVSPKPIPLWAKCFGWMMFLVMLTGFLIGGWCLIFARFVASRGHTISSHHQGAPHDRT